MAKRISALRAGSSAIVALGLLTACSTGATEQPASTGTATAMPASVTSCTAFQVAAGFATTYGHAQTPLLWTPKCSSAFGDMMTRVIKEGADPTAEIAKVKTVVEAELARLRS